MRKLSDTVFVSPQFSLDDLTDIQAEGVKLIINNRLDYESPGQPTSQEVEEAVKMLGMDYVHIPMSGGALSLQMIDAMRDVLKTAKGLALAYCLSGTRSAILWMFATANEDNIDALLAATDAAGYSLGHMKPMLKQYVEGKR